MRVLTWNISHGGGQRIPAICRHISDVGSDLLALTEFQTRNAPVLRSELMRMGYPFIATSNPMPKQNGLLVASRWPLDRGADQDPSDVDRERLLAVRLPEVDLDVLVLHIPGTPDNKFEDGFGISGTKRKELLWGRALSYAAEHRNRRAIIIGDFNTGLRIDTEGAVFKYSHYMTDLLNAGFIDTWRHRHPHDREYTWYSKRKDKVSGKSVDLNGFRLDYIFVSGPLKHAIANAAILHEPRRDDASDHASVIADISIQQVNAQDATRHNQSDTMAPFANGSGDRGIGQKYVRRDRETGTSKSQARKLRTRCELAPGSLPDMKCGLNGQGFVQWLRPTYITAEWIGGTLKEVKIWGPRVLRDGSLGKRELDHQWIADATTGGVRYSDLPPLVAEQLRAYLQTVADTPN